jgi:peptidoglycan/LPS O-acetylase OafA/YrhL
LTLDGIRAIAILLVILHHSVGFNPGVPMSPLEQVIGDAGSEGWIGVDLFFVLSGYLITGILLRTKGSSGYFRDFMARRILRIFPAYYLFLFVMFVALPRMFPAHPELAKLPGCRRGTGSTSPT